jgi:serine/threonine-protein kinase
MYLALEFIEGKSLRSLIGERAPMSAQEALSIARQLCEALVYMHAQGIVHRDLKPENVLVTDAGKAKLLDFGIALDESARRLTWVGLSSTIGTPDYMAPEQIAGRRGDVRTDIYSLGVILFEMLTAELPHRAANVHAFLRAKTQEDPKPPSYFIPGFDPSLEAIILKALERKPRDRYASAAEMLRDLENPAAVPPRDPTSTARGRRRPLLPRHWVVPIVVGLVICALASLIWWTSPPPAPKPEIPANPRRG